MAISHRNIENIITTVQKFTEARNDFYDSFSTFWHHGDDDEIWQQTLTTRMVRAARELQFELDEVHMAGWDYGFVAGMEHERKYGHIS